MTLKIELEFIPVSERLPEKEGEYLCRLRWGQVLILSLRNLQCCSQGGLQYESITHWSKLPDLSEKKEEPLQDIVNAYANCTKSIESSNERQRRRDMFEKVYTAMIHGGYYQDIIARQTKDPAAAAKALAGMAAFYAKAGLEQSDKFARGE